MLQVVGRLAELGIEHLILAWWLLYNSQKLSQRNLEASIYSIQTLVLSNQLFSIGNQRLIIAGTCIEPRGLGNLGRVVSETGTCPAKRHVSAFGDRSLPLKVHSTI